MSRYDVVQACNPPDFLLFAALDLRYKGVATVFDHHDLSPELYCAKYRDQVIIPGILRLVETGAFALADAVLATNESFREIAITRGRKLSDDVFVVRNGPDTDVLRPVTPDLELRSRAKHLIGYVGLMGRQDGIDVALEALATLRRRREDWHAFFVGDGDAFADANELTRRLGLNGFVSFLGYIGERDVLARIISSCDVCISPEPRNELNEHSTLIKVAEYMAVGRPVVAFDLSETRRTAGGAAEYARGDGPEAFAAAIERLLDQPGRREEMGALGRIRAETALGWDRSEKVLMTAYEHALAQARKRRRK